MHHPAPPGLRVIDQTHSGEIDLALHARLPVGDGHRLPRAAATVVGALHAVPVQHTVRHQHAAAGEQVTDLDHRQVLAHPLHDPRVLALQRLPPVAVALRPRRPHRGHHLPHQLVGQLPLTAVAVEPGRQRRVHIVTRGLAVDTRLPGHLPQPLPGQPGTQHLSNLDHRNLPEHHPDGNLQIDRPGAIRTG